MCNKLLPFSPHPRDKNIEHILKWREWYIMWHDMEYTFENELMFHHYNPYFKSPICVGRIDVFHNDTVWKEFASFQKFIKDIKKQRMQ
jgi:hypothetical protein